MCVKLTRTGGKVTGVQINFKRTMVTIVSISALFGALAVLKMQCNNGIAYAQETFVRGEAADVFDSLHKPFEGRLCALADTINEMRDQTKILIEMMKMANSDKPHLYRDAKNRVVNSGRFTE